MVLALWFLAGAALGAVIWRLLEPAFAQALFQRTNYRGRTVPAGAGVVLVLAAAAATAVAGAVVASGHELAGGDGRGSTLAVVAGFGLLGLLDDLAGDGGDKGYRGHLRALVHGRLTTGALKLFGGVAVAVAVTGWLGEPDLFRLLVDGAVVALAANLANLFDRAPGRIAKVGLLAFLVLAVSSRGDEALSAAAVVAGASFGLLVGDLRERLMLGDAGANPLGAALGLGVVLTAPATTRLVVAVVLVALNLLSEKVSFSRIIDATPPLRFLDRLGRTQH